MKNVQISQTFYSNLPQILLNSHSNFTQISSTIILATRRNTDLIYQNHGTKQYPIRFLYSSNVCVATPTPQTANNQHSINFFHNKHNLHYKHTTIYLVQNLYYQSFFYNPPHVDLLYPFPYQALLFLVFPVLHDRETRYPV